MERIEINENKPETQTNITYNLPRPLTAENVINKALWGVLALLVLAVLATFFVEDLPGVVLNIRDIARDSLWVMFCCYSIGELLKKIYRNKGRSTDEYATAKKAAQDALDSLTEDELAERNNYCREYEDKAFELVLSRRLTSIGISNDDYWEKYAGLTKKELQERYGATLPKSTICALAKANKIKKMAYDPSFFLSTVHTEMGLSPSQMYNSHKEDVRDTISSIGTTFISSLCAVSIAGDLIFSFGTAALFAAIIKITITVIVGSFKATRGWNLAMVTEINHYLITVKECKNLKAYCAAKAKE